jgi:hypothetical protein
MPPINAREVYQLIFAFSPTKISPIVVERFFLQGIYCGDNPEDPVLNEKGEPVTGWFVQVLHNAAIISSREDAIRRAAEMVLKVLAAIGNPSLSAEAGRIHHEMSANSYPEA